MKTVTFILLFAIPLFFSCKKTTDKVVYTPPVFDKTFKKTVTIVGDTIEALGSDPIIVDSFLVIKHESMKNEQLFHVYNRKTGKYVQSFGNKGRGYGELISSNGISMDYNSKTIYVGAMNQSRATVFDLDSLRYGKVGISEIRLRLPLNSTGFYRVTPENFLTIYNLHNRFALYDKEMNVIDSCNYYSPTKSGISEGYALINYYLYSSGILVKPDGSKFANLTTCGLIVEIFGMNQNKIEHLNTTYFYEPTYNIESGDPLWGRCIRGLRTYFATDKYIYIVLNGTLDDEIRLDKISVFDWEGHCVKQYDLEVNIMRISIDEEAGIGYVILRDESLEYRLGYFEL